MELYNAIKAIDINKLSEEEKEELLGIFMVTKNVLIRNHIALIFADLHYEKAVPYIFDKINDKSTYNKNGTLVYSLQKFELKEYCIQLIKIICDQDYEARLMAYGIVEDLAPSIPGIIKNKAFEILEAHRVILELEAIDKGANSTLHFVEQTQKLLS